MNEKPVVYFSDIAVERLEAECTLPEKFKRALKRVSLPGLVKGKRVVIKMHMGGNVGYTTIRPLFARLLVQELKNAGAKSIKAIYSDPASGIPRGYTEEVIGCQILPAFGKDNKYVKSEKIGFKTLDEVLFSGEALDSDFFIDFAHVKGHGDCGFGASIKNISMGLVPQPSRQKIHGLEGWIKYDKKKCSFCLKCVKACEHKAMRANKEKKEISVFYHHCTICQHCVMACKNGAIVLENRNFDDFAEGMAIVASAFLKKFKPENTLFINFLMDITVYCDCWGFSTASLVPDIGILVSQNIAAIDTASLDMIKTEDLLPKGLPGNRKLMDKGKHLFEKIHGKDPYSIIRFMKKYHGCSQDYRLEEVK